MTVHRDKFLVNETTDALNSNFIGITTLHVSGSLGVLSRSSALVHFCRYDVFCCQEQDGTQELERI